MSLRVYADRLVVAAEGQIVCKHVRIIDRRHDTVGQTVYDWRHYQGQGPGRGERVRSQGELPCVMTLRVRPS